jgi:hypothetical protein
MMMDDEREMSMMMKESIHGFLIRGILGLLEMDFIEADSLNRLDWKI